MEKTLCHSMSEMGPVAWYPGTNSLMVGTSGNPSARVAAVTASARSLPALTYSIEDERVAK
jgi:hypothetical protein